MDHFKRSAIVFVSTLLFVVPIFGLARGKISVGPELSKQIESILDASQELHTGLTKSNQDIIEVQIASLLKDIEQAYRLSKQAGANRPHLIRILERLQKSLDQSRSSRDEKRKKDLIQDAYSQIVLLAQTYDLENNYRIYFCSKDKATWLQKPGTPVNPVNPKSNCGAIVKY